MCTNCSGGTASNATRATVCVPCEPGRWSSEGAPVCSPCEAGGYSLGGTSFCFDCNPGFYSLQEATKCLPCGAGTFSYARAGVCAPCPPGTFALWEQGACSVCTGGTYSASEASTECSQCEMGEWSEDSAPSCTACRAGTYSLTPLANSTDACLLCSYGKFSATTGADSEDACSACPVGGYTPAGSSICTLCPANLYSDGVNPGCLACPAFTTTSIEGAKLYECLCDVGYETVWREEDMLWFECEKCSAGKYTAEKGTDRCVSCSPGQYGFLDPYQSGIAWCAACPPGAFSPTEGETSCTDCGLGYFQGSPNQTRCDACPIGSTSDSIASTNCSECQPGSYSGWEASANCSACVPGTYAEDANASACRQCEPGKYLGNSSGTACWLCGVGTYSTAAGNIEASACVLCKKGYFSLLEGAGTQAACVLCPSGFTSNPGASECFPCPAGQITNSLYGACSTCPMHSSTPENITRLEQCRCDGGYYLGYNSKARGGVETYETGTNRQLYKIHTFFSYTDGILVYVPAEIGVSCSGVQISQQYLWNPGLYPSKIVPGQCKLPYVMSYPVDIVFNENETSTFVQCIPCPRGTLSVDGGYWEDCVSCPKGKFQDDMGQSACKTCPAGTDSPVGADICRPCQEGTVYYNFSCVQCPDGFYTELVDDERPTCLPCSNNTWSNSLTGGCRLCPSQSSSAGGTGLDGCLCFGGLELSTVSNIPYCTRCVEGKYAAPFSNRCVPCPSGSFGQTSAASACVPCPNAHAWFAPPGSLSCKVCPATRTATPEKDSCMPCPPGGVCHPQTTTVIPCPIGTYDNVGGLSSLSQCVLCPANNYCLTPTSITPCPVGTVASPGAINQHGCLCTDQYSCTYTTSTTTRLALAISQADWELQRQQLIASIAASMGKTAFPVPLLLPFL